jgi:hypothetical protein
VTTVRRIIMEWTVYIRPLSMMIRMALLMALLEFPILEDAVALVTFHIRAMIIPSGIVVNLNNGKAEIRLTGAEDVQTHGYGEERIEPRLKAGVGVRSGFELALGIGDAIAGGGIAEHEDDG